ncbi:hypothetical protein K1719_032086 [Acacia pycnantha]|nr:hypothetical protein K1719_032086 [Acacia pycnantha]
MREFIRREKGREGGPQVSGYGRQKQVQAPLSIFQETLQGDASTTTIKPCNNPTKTEIHTYLGRCWDAVEKQAAGFKESRRQAEERRDDT